MTEEKTGQRQDVGRRLCVRATTDTGTNRDGECLEELASFKLEPQSDPCSQPTPRLSRPETPRFPSHTKPQFKPRTCYQKSLS
jgi:hypothetical protein